MSIFNTILEKLGIEKPSVEGKGTAGYSVVSSPAAAPAAPASMTPIGVITGSTPDSAVLRKDIPMVDVVSKLDSLQASFHNKELTWKVSISDLLYILKIDNSGANLKALATELGCPADLMSDSAKRNMWLHSTVLKKIAENGGNIPPELLRK